MRKPSFELLRPAVSLSFPLLNPSSTSLAMASIRPWGICSWRDFSSWLIILRYFIVLRPVGPWSKIGRLQNYLCIVLPLGVQRYDGRPRPESTAGRENPENPKP